MSTTTIFDPKITCNEGGDTFIELLDTPESYEDQAGKIVTVNSSGTGLTFETTSVGGGGGGNTNIYKIDAGKTYTILEGQQLVVSQDFYLNGDITVTGDWSFIVSYSTKVKENITSFVFSGKYRSEEIWQYNAKTNDYYMMIHHGLDRYPLVRMMDLVGTELEPKIVHISKNRLMIVSNIKISSQLFVI